MPSKGGRRHTAEQVIARQLLVVRLRSRGMPWPKVMEAARAAGHDVKDRQLWDDYEEGMKKQAVFRNQESARRRVVHMLEEHLATTYQAFETAIKANPTATVCASYLEAIGKDIERLSAMEGIDLRRIAVQLDDVAERIAAEAGVTVDELHQRAGELRARGGLRAVK